MSEKVHTNNNKSKCWWERFFPDQTIETMIYNNAKRTACCMLSVIQSYLEPLWSMSSSERVSPINNNMRPLAIYAPAYDEVELEIVLSLLSIVFKKGSILLIPEADCFKEVIKRTNWDAVCSSRRPVADSDSVVFGFGRHALLYFIKMARETTGFEYLPKLAYERPDVLTFENGIAWELGDWHVVKVPSMLMTPRELTFGSSEADETIAALIAPTPKDIKGDGFDPDPFLHDKEELEWIILDD